MAIQPVKDLLHQYIERVWNGRDLSALDELTSSNFVYYLGGQPGRDRSAMRQFLEAVHVAFPDWRVEIVDCVAEDQKAVVRWVGQVTHSGPFHGIPPTGKRVAVSGINAYHLAGNKIEAEWEQMDSLGLLQQLGAFTPLARH